MTLTRNSAICQPSYKEKTVGKDAIDDKNSFERKSPLKNVVINGIKFVSIKKQLSITKSYQWQKVISEETH